MKGRCPLALEQVAPFSVSISFAVERRVWTSRSLRLLPDRSFGSFPFSLCGVPAHESLSCSYSQVVRVGDRGDLAQDWPPEEVEVALPGSWQVSRALSNCFCSSFHTDMEQGGPVRPVRGSQGASHPSRPGPAATLDVEATGFVDWLWGYG